jgi:hypothetical protein
MDGPRYATLFTGKSQYIIRKMAVDQVLVEDRKISSSGEIHNAGSSSVREESASSL